MKIVFQIECEFCIWRMKMAIGIVCVFVSCRETKCWYNRLKMISSMVLVMIMTCNNNNSEKYNDRLFLEYRMDKKLNKKELISSQFFEFLLCLYNYQFTWIISGKRSIRKKSQRINEIPFELKFFLSMFTLKWTTTKKKFLVSFCFHFQYIFIINFHSLSFFLF